MSDEARIASAPPATPPANLDAERSLLGLLMANNEAFERVRGFLRSAHFGDPAHAVIYDCIASLIAAGQRADIAAIKAEVERLHREGVLENVDGVDDYLASLQAAMGGFDQAADYSHAIQRCFLLREIINIAERLMQIGLNDPDDLQQEWKLTMLDIAELSDSEELLRTAGALLRAKYPQYARMPLSGPVIVVRVGRYRGWAAEEAVT